MESIRYWTIKSAFQGQGGPLGGKIRSKFANLYSTISAFARFHKIL